MREGFKIGLILVENMSLALPMGARLTLFQANTVNGLYVGQILLAERRRTGDHLLTCDFHFGSSHRFLQCTRLRDTLHVLCHSYFLPLAPWRPQRTGRPSHWN